MGGYIGVGGIWGEVLGGDLLRGGLMRWGGIMRWGGHNEVCGGVFGGVREGLGGVRRGYIGVGGLGVAP